MASAASSSWHRGSPDSDLGMLATEFVWCLGDERMRRVPVPSPLSLPLLLTSWFCSPSFPGMWTPEAQAQLRAAYKPGELRAAGME